MANAFEVGAAYGYMDRMMRASFNPPDITCAFFDGDFSLSLEEAQRKKHDFILDELGYPKKYEGPMMLAPNFLDIGNGWGGLLQAAKDRGLSVFGCTPEFNQAKYTMNKHFPRIVDGGWDDLRVGGIVQMSPWHTQGTGGSFKGIASVGAMEHFTGVEEFVGGKQDEILGRFFAKMQALLDEPGERKLFLQTMVLGENAPDPLTASLDAPVGSDEYVTARVMDFYPNSLPPKSLQQLIDCAEPYFEIETASNGKNDYIETMKRWSNVWKITPRKLFAAVQTLPALRDEQTRYRIGTLRGGYNRQCFERDILDHWRIIFKSKPIESDNPYFHLNRAWYSRNRT